MKILEDLDQGSDAWKAARAGKVTASRAKDARDRLKNGNPSSKQTAYAAQVAVERIAGKPMDMTFENWQMREGHVQEPVARAAYEAATGNLVTEVGAISTDDDCFLYSPDGLVGDDGLLEIKTLFSPERIVNIMADGDIQDFIDQCMFGLWLTGRKWIDLVIWCPALEHMEIKHIERDENSIELLEEDLMAFLETVRLAESKLRKVLKT
jgi:exodeoxyribonuclease (lambda-induced)